MNTFALLLFLYWVLFFGTNAVKAGDDQEITAWNLLLSHAFSWAMLIFGGFFTLGWHWQQFLMVTMTALSWGIFLGNGFKPIETKYNPVSYLIAACLVCGFLVPLDSLRGNQSPRPLL
jgi:hypothetical protein